MIEVTAPERRPGSVGKVVAVVTLLALALYVVAGLFYLISNNDLIGRVEAVGAFVGGGGGPLALLWTRLRRRLEQGLADERRTTSDALMGLLATEPLVIGFVWIFLLVGGSVAAVYAPVRIIVNVDTSNLPVDDSLVRVVTEPGRDVFERIDSLRFRSRGRYPRGDSIVLRAYAGPYEDSSIVTIEGLQLFATFSGQVVALRLRGELYRLTVEAPAAAVVVFDSGGITHRSPPPSLDVVGGTVVRVRVEQPGHATRDTAITVGRADTSVTVEMVPLEGAIRIRFAGNAARQRREGLSVYVRRAGSDAAFDRVGQVGESIPLDAGRWNVRACRLRQDGSLYRGELTVLVGPGVELVIDTITTRSERGSCED